MFQILQGESVNTLGILLAYLTNRGNVISNVETVIHRRSNGIPSGIPNFDSSDDSDDEDPRERFNRQAFRRQYQTIDLTGTSPTRNTSSSNSNSNSNSNSRSSNSNSTTVIDLTQEDN